MNIPVDSQTAIVFDLDDTLYNEIEFLKSAYRELAKKIAPNSWRLLFATLFSRYRNKENVFEYVSNTYEMDMQELIDAYRNHYPSIEPFKGVITLMQAIKNKNGKIGIITDGRSTTQRNKLKALGLIDFIDCIIISGEIGSEKPNKANYAAIEEKIDCTTFYYIGDNFKKDFISPKQNGWKTIGLVDNGLNIHSNAFKYQNATHTPEALIVSIDELKVV